MNATVSDIYGEDLAFVPASCQNLCRVNTYCMENGILGMGRRLGGLIFLSMLLAIMGGCVYAISRENRESALKDLTPESILRDFETYRGRLVLMGGEIIKTRNLEKETQIEVLQRPLSRSSDRPLEDKKADGRFLVTYRTFQDPYVFSQGRSITVAGVVVGKEVSQIGQKNYIYLVLENRETHLWPEREDYYGYYPYGYPYPPYWYPYPGHWYPYYRRYPYPYHPYWY